MAAVLKKLKIVEKSPASPFRRKRRSRSELHDSIIRAASELFAEKGFAEPTIREIADGADVALPTLYRLFEDKKDIYVHCCRLAAQRHIHYLIGQNASESGEVMLYRILRRGALSCQERSVEHRLVHRIYMDGDQDIISKESDEFSASKATKKIMEVFEKGSGGGLAELRRAMLDRFYQQLPVAFTIWPELFDKDDPDLFVTNVLTILLPAIDWAKIARQA